MPESEATRSRMTPVYPSGPARRLLWHVLSIADRTIVRSYRVEPLQKPGAVIGWVVGSPVELQLESGRFVLHPGPFIHVVSMQWPRAYRPLTDKAYRHRTIRFGGPLLDAWIEEMDIAQNPEFGFEPSDPALSMRDQVTAIALRQAPDWEREVHLVLSDLLSRLLALRRALKSFDRQLPIPVARVIDAVEAAPDRDWKVSELPPISGVGYSLLRRMFRSSLGESIHSFLQQTRIDRARLLLSDEVFTVKEIAAKLNFGNEYYFSSFFKARTGLSPTQFRRQSG